MKIKGKNVQIGDLVIIVEKYNEDFHNIPLDRVVVGWVVSLECQDRSSIQITSKRLLGVKKVADKLFRAKGFKENFKNIFKLAGLNWFYKLHYLNEDTIKTIEVIKKK